MRVCIIVGLGGFLGSVCRYLLTLLPVANQAGFPLTTLAINVAGSLIIGLLVGLSGSAGGMHPDVLTFLKVGFCGGFTTFSTFALELNSLFGSGKAWLAIAYVLLSTVLGLGAVFAGKAIAS